MGRGVAFLKKKKKSKMFESSSTGEETQRAGGEWSETKELLKFTVVLSVS